MKILITGNMGYIGPCVVNHLRRSYSDSLLVGFDSGYFGNCITSADILPECRVDLQYFGDIRKFPDEVLNGVDAIVHLAGISNDPIGNKFEEVTLDINYRASINLAKKAVKAGVKSFVFASSCSMYGSADDSARNEKSTLNPLTAYARSKAMTEKELEPLASERFKITSLRFSTACGWSERLRLDLVLNDFVAGAVASGKITILSDGKPWRPLINVKDMARAIDWAIHRETDSGGAYLAVNVGSEAWNYQVIELAEAVAKVIPGVQISINKNAQPDKRSYRVNFDLFRKLAPAHQPGVNLQDSVKELKNGLEAMGFKDGNFRSSNYMRLNILTQLQEKGFLDEKLQWIKAFKGGR
jgi:nucleoside-diphosphate-sugar epimerase